MRSTWVIVGGGSAGGLLAARLSEDPRRSVVLLDKGPDHGADGLPAHARYVFMASARGVPGCPAAEPGELMAKVAEAFTQYPAIAARRPIAIPRGEMIGGSSQLNAAIYLWGAPADYDAWVALGNAGWAYRDVQPTFASLETDTDYPSSPHGESGPIQVSRSPVADWLPLARAFGAACASVGHAPVADFNNGAPEGYGPTPFNQLHGVRYGTAVAFLTAEVRRRPNLRIVGGAEVVRVAFERGRAVGVDYRTAAGVERLAADHTIVSAGAIGSPLLLLRSGVGPADQLRECGVPVVLASDGVGAGVQDHPCINLTWRLRDGADRTIPTHPYQVSLRYTAHGSRHALDAQMNVLPIGYFVDERGRLRFEPGVVGIATHLYHALSRGALRLDPRAIHGPPQLDYRLLSHPEDLARMRAIVRHAFELAAQPSMRELLVEPERLGGCDGELTAAEAARDDALDDYLLEHVVTGQHISSTCRMGPAGDPGAVVDPLGRVHGAQGIWVIDASIMRTCIRANTNATTMMVAEHIFRRSLSQL
jgi:choline dehydrogenase